MMRNQRTLGVALLIAALLQPSLASSNNNHANDLNDKISRHKMLTRETGIQGPRSGFSAPVPLGKGLYSTREILDQVRPGPTTSHPALNPKNLRNGIHLIPKITETAQRETPRDFPFLHIPKLTKKEKYQREERAHSDRVWGRRRQTNASRRGYTNPLHVAQQNQKKVRENKKKVNTFPDDNEYIIIPCVKGRTDVPLTFHHHGGDKYSFSTGLRQKSLLSIKSRNSGKYKKYFTKSEIEKMIEKNHLKQQQGNKLWRFSIVSRKQDNFNALHIERTRTGWLRQLRCVTESELSDDM